MSLVWRRKPTQTPGACSPHVEEEAMLTPHRELRSGYAHSELVRTTCRESKVFIVVSERPQWKASAWKAARRMGGAQYRLNMGIKAHDVSLSCMAFIVLHSAVQRDKKWELERNSNPGSFLTSSQLANQGVKWVWMSDCGFRKERKKKEGVVLCVKSEIDESFFPPTVWHSLLLLFAPVEKKRRKKKKKPKHSTVTNPTPHDHLSMTHNGSDSF